MMKKKILSRKKKKIGESEQKGKYQRLLSRWLKYYEAVLMLQICT